MRRALLAAGLAVIVVAGASAAAAHPFLSDYRWVAPPDGAPATDPPLARTLEIPASPSAVLATEVWTGDLQAVLDLVETPVPAAPERTAAVAELTPRDPADFAPLPRSLFPAANAYEVRVTETDRAALPIEAPGRILLATAHPDARVLFSADGEAWEEVAVEEAIPTQVTATFAASGFYLPVVDHDPSPSAAPGDDGVPVLAIVLALGAAGILWFGAAHLRRS